MWITTSKQTHLAYTCSCSPPHLQLGDFGLSKVLGRGAGRDAAACVAGTLPFLAPELLVPGATTSFAADVSVVDAVAWIGLKIWLKIS
jgi:serine/threonine protein kinase